MQDSMHPQEKAHLEDRLGVTLTYNPLTQNWDLSEKLSVDQLRKLVDVIPDEEIINDFYKDGRLYFNETLEDDDGIDYDIEMAFDPHLNTIGYI